MNKKVSIIGFFLIAATTVLSVVSAILYQFSYATDQLATYLFVGAAVVGVIALGLAMALGKEIPNLFVACHTLILMAAIGVSIPPMVNEMGLVYAGLDPQSNLTGYIIFAVVACITWLIALIASFFGVTRKAA